jgi:hypothetical protein
MHVCYQISAHVSRPESVKAYTAAEERAVSIFWVRDCVGSSGSDDVTVKRKA